MPSRVFEETHKQYLRDPEIAAAYLNDALESKDPKIIFVAILDVVAVQEKKINFDKEDISKIVFSEEVSKLINFSSFILGNLGLQLHVVSQQSQQGSIN